MVGVRSKSKGLLHILLVLLACFGACDGFVNITEPFGREGAINVTDENASNFSSGGNDTDEVPLVPDDAAHPKRHPLPFRFITLIFCTKMSEIFTGIILSENSVITTCRNTYERLDFGFPRLQPEDCVVTSRPLDDNREPTVFTRVLSILQHRECDQPRRGGSWKNNLAIFILTTELDFIPHQIEKVEFATMDFKELYKGMKKAVNGKVTCSLVGLNYFWMTWISTNVTIVREPRCKRICDYLIEHCTYEMGGYFVVITDGNKFKVPLSGAALMCDGHLYGVVDTKQKCGRLYDGLMSKPEAMLELVLLADSAGDTSQTRNGSITRS